MEEPTELRKFVIKAVGGASFNLEMDKNSKIEAVKIRLAEMTEANVDDLTLLFGGRKLEDDMMLSTYLQADGMTILLRMPIREGGVAR